MIVKNVTKQVKLASRAGVADNVVSRGIGLLGRGDLPSGEALIIGPCNSVHCMFMRFPIDVLFVDKSGCILHAIRNMKPFRVSKIVRGSAYVVELQAGLLEETGTEVGDKVEILDGQGSGMSGEEERG